MILLNTYYTQNTLETKLTFFSCIEESEIRTALELENILVVLDHVDCPAELLPMRLGEDLEEDVKSQATDIAR